jgi:uncharacterized protein with PIN domain
MTSLSADPRCVACGGQLAAVKTLLIDQWPKGTRPDYLCPTCKRPYYWRDDPPRLLLGAQKR